MAKLPGAVQGARIVGERFVHSQRQQNPEGRMPLMDHFRELRNRVRRSAPNAGPRPRGHRYITGSHRQVFWLGQAPPAVQKKSQSAERSTASRRT